MLCIVVAVPFRQATNLKMSSPIRYYYDLMSQPSRALFIIFRLSNMPFEDCVVALRNGKGNQGGSMSWAECQLNFFGLKNCLKSSIVFSTSLGVF